MRSPRHSWQSCIRPRSFFLPTDRFNERFEELNNHPDWSFYGATSKQQELLEARNRVLARHPKPIHSIARREWREILRMSAMHGPLRERYSGTGRANGELGASRGGTEVFDKYQDRILFGTDAVPNGTDTPQQIFGASCTRSITGFWRRRTNT